MNTDQGMYYPYPKYAGNRSACHLFSPTATTSPTATYGVKSGQVSRHLLFRACIADCCYLWLPSSFAVIERQLQCMASLPINCPAGCKNLNIYQPLSAWKADIAHDICRVSITFITWRMIALHALNSCSNQRGSCFRVVFSTMLVIWYLLISRLPDACLHRSKFSSKNDCESPPVKGSQVLNSFRTLQWVLCVHDISRWNNVIYKLSSLPQTSSPVKICCNEDW